MQLPGPEGASLPLRKVGAALMPRRLYSQRMYGSLSFARSASSSSGCVHMRSAAATARGNTVFSKSLISTNHHPSMPPAPHSPHMHTSPPTM